MPTASIFQRDFTLRTGRLALVPIAPEHAEAYFREFTAEIARYQFPEPFGCVEDARAFVARAQALYEEGEALVCAILGPDGDFLGSAELRNLTSPTPETGLWLKKSAQGKGCGKEAMTALLGFFRETRKPDFFVYETDRRNLAGMRLVKALGGEYQCAYDVESAGGELLRLKLYYIP